MLGHEAKDKRTGAIKMRSIKELMHDTKAQGLFGMKIDDIVEALVALIIMGALVPVALKMYTGADIDKMMVNFPNIKPIWELLPFIVLLSIIIGVIYGALSYIRK